MSSLESHVDPEWWRHIFTALYLKTDGDVVDDDRLTRWEVDRLVQAVDVSAGDRVLDLCCGQGRHLLELARLGFGRLRGVDRSRYLISRARSSARQEALRVVFGEGDVRHLSLPGGAFDVVLNLGNSFGYFPSAVDDQQVLHEARRLLARGGRLFMDIADGDHVRAAFQPRSWEWIDHQLFVCRERELSADGARLISREVVTHSKRGVIADQFYAERLYGPAELRELLRGAGFGAIQVRDSFDTASARGQDLGMMERRLVVTAVAGAPVLLAAGVPPARERSDEHAERPSIAAKR